MVDFTWTGNAGNGLYSTAGNWTPAGGPPNASSNVTINGGANITLPSGGININGLTISGAVSFSGTQIISVNQNGVTLNSGSNLNLGTATLADHDNLNLSGTGTYTISNGSISDQTGFSIASGQNLVLNNTTLTTNNGVSGAGTLTLTGSTLNAISGPNPGVAINLTTVYAGQTHNLIRSSRIRWRPRFDLKSRLRNGDQRQRGRHTSLTLAQSCGGATRRLYVGRKQPWKPGHDIQPCHASARRNASRLHHRRERKLRLHWRAADLFPRRHPHPHGPRRSAHRRSADRRSCDHRLGRNEGDPVCRTQGLPRQKSNESRRRLAGASRSWRFRRGASLTRSLA